MPFNSSLVGALKTTCSSSLGLIQVLSSGECQTYSIYEFWTIENMEEGTNMKSNNSHFKEAKYLGKLCHILSVFICYKTNALVSKLPRAKIPGSARRMMGDCIGKHEAGVSRFCKISPAIG